MKNLSYDSVIFLIHPQDFKSCHYPLTPEGTARAFKVASEKGVHVAFHAGTLNTKSTIEGFHEAIELIRNDAVHLAHINSYCRGTVKPWTAETEEAILTGWAHINCDSGGEMILATGEDAVIGLSSARTSASTGF